MTWQRFCDFDMGEMMLEKEDVVYQKLVGLYPPIFKWLTSKTLGEGAKKSYYQYYDKELWLPIKDIIISIRDKKDKSKIDNELLECCHIGEVYRIHRYNDCKKGHIYPWGCYQSWALEGGLEKFTKLGGTVLLLCGHAAEEDFAINTFDLLCFMFRNFQIVIPDRFHEPKQLLTYEDELEIVMSIKQESLDNVVIVDSREIINWRECGVELPKEKWFRIL